MFKDSYFKVADNNHYYYREDQFDTVRNNAAIKIHNLLELSLEMMESVLDVNIRAAQGYQGFQGSMLRRYPDAYTTFADAANTRLISPLKGGLTAGTTELFSIESKDYTRLAIIINGELTFFEKNSSGIFELSFDIPSELKELEIYGTKNNRNYSGLLKYEIINAP
ncbi:hypothetical protein FACS1894110_24960 [Spirochaetia bacterium]|nr:hypothetical protein FACS1894110_24960 [Spirochaetia bacterium]